MEHLREQFMLIHTWAGRTHDLRGTFAAAYVIVTRAIEWGIRAKAFAEPTWVTQVMLDFGKRYLEALQNHLGGANVIAAWNHAFELRRGGSVQALGALLSSMVAHIHYDLPQSLHAARPLLPQRIVDYGRIGELIEGSTGEIQELVIDAYAWDLAPLHRRMNGLDLRLTNSVLRAWRRRALTVASEMARHPSDAIRWTTRLDAESAALARCCSRAAHWLQEIQKQNDGTDAIEEPRADELLYDT
ncbi:MAG: hypothetical protein IPM54_09690 [Polyangiaceae bacterium]|nr:hypothetical protein [Polyangiaceae bacterium]